MLAELHNLIHSMTTGEKRRFRLNATDEEMPVYVDVFEYFLSVDEFDITAFREKFSGAKFMRQLPVMKNYLQDKVLETLHSHITANSHLMLLRRKLEYADILLSRGLSSLAEKEIRKVKKETILLGETLLLCQTLKLEIRMKRITRGGAKEIATLRQELKQALEQAALEAEIGEFYDQAFALFQMWAGNKPGDTIAGLPALHRRASALSKKKPQGLFARVMIHLGFAYLHHLGNDLKSAVHVYESLISMTDDCPSFAVAHPDLALTIYRSFVECRYFLGQPDGTAPAIKRIKSLRFPSRAQKARQAASLCHLLLQHEVELHQFTAAIAMENAIHYKIKKWGPAFPFNYKLTLYHNLCISFFLSGDTHRCRYYIRLMQEMPQNITRMDIPEFSRLLDMLIFFERGEYDYLDYLARSTRRLLNRHKTLGDFESTLLKYLGKLSASHSLGSRLNLFRQLKSKLIEVGSSAGNSPGVAVVTLWVTQKIKSLKDHPL